MTDTVTTQEQAEKLAVLLLQVREEWRKQFIEEGLKKRGRKPDGYEYDTSVFYFPLRKATENPKGWILEYERELRGGSIDGDTTAIISVNKETGETKFGDFAK
jgi:hypothetical protein